MKKNEMSKELEFLMGCFPNLPEEASKGMAECASKLFDRAIKDSIYRLEPKLKKIIKEEIEPEIQVKFREYLQENKKDIVSKLIQKKMKEVLK